MALRFFLALFLSLLLTNAMAQDTLNQNDSQGRKQGFWVRKDSLGRKVYEGRFLNGKPVGEFRYYYPTGQLKTVSQLRDEGRIAKTVTLFPNGKKMASGRYLNEKKDSTWQFFREEDGLLVSEENYREGKRNGIAYTYYPGGKVSEMVTWVEGVRTGPWEQYYSDGKTRLKGAYTKDEKNGPFYTFYPSGSAMMAGAYASGRMDGLWIYYDEKGKIQKRESYSKGALLKREELTPAPGGK